MGPNHPLSRPLATPLMDQSRGRWDGICVPNSLKPMSKLVPVAFLAGRAWRDIADQRTRACRMFCRVPGQLLDLLLVRISVHGNASEGDLP